MSWFKNYKTTELKAEVVLLKGERDTSTKEATSARQELRKVKEELVEVKHQKKIEEEDIKHMVKMKEERTAVENEKKLLEMEREKDKAIAEAKDEFRDKLEGFLQTQVKDTKDMYSEILKRLPDVTAHFGTPKETAK